MAFKKKTPGKNVAHGLGKREQSFLHLKEFSQGKPNELSLNVLEQKAAIADGQEKSHHLQGLRGVFSRGTSKPVSPAPASTNNGEGASEANDATSSNGAPAGKPSEGEDKKPPALKPPAPKRSKKRRNRASIAASAHAAPAKKASSSTLFTADSRTEIEQRQSRRRLVRRLGAAFVAVVCVCLLCVGGYYAYQQYQRLTTAVGVLNEACDLIVQADETIVVMDEYFQTSFNDDTVTTAQSLQGQLPEMREKLEQARVYANKAEGELDGSQRDKEAAERVLNAVASRETMLDSAEQRFVEDISAKQAIDTIEQAEYCIQEGNALLSQSAKVIADTTNENVAASTEYTTSAQEQFAEARTYIEQAQSQYPAADFSALLEYVDKRSAAASEALLSNAAILIQDKATAESHNDAYNAADAEAVEIAKALPEDYAQPIIDAYAQATEQATTTYEAARQSAAANDAYLREYLGTGSN